MAEAYTSEALSLLFTQNSEGLCLASVVGAGRARGRGGGDPTPTHHRPSAAGGLQQWPARPETKVWNEILTV